ncbi:MAG: sterol desaturase/sphingolipid hydroxylase (fatty acid hydroxylase superfamily) [Paraglaciecola sp.]|jgi:sterol desaturase/sphingolipid hydroxylase (fatty acid hydroxylase superfamily)
MESFLNFFETMPNAYKFAWIFAVLTFTWIIEAAIPLLRNDYKKWKHARMNLVLLFTSMLVSILFGLATKGLFDWTGATGFGLFHLINLPVWAELLLAVMLLDLWAQYAAHYMLHRVAWMWRFHMVHHSDTTVDATTGTRHHPGDYIIRECFALVAILLLGMPLAFYVFYRILTIFFTYFSHANIHMPQWLDKPLSFVFITPNMHKFHHHFERPWTDTNFGNIFSFWDRLFGTFVHDDPKKVQYGLDVLDDETSGDLMYQFKLPFDKRIKTD